jgi:hypothetical protein
MKKLIVILLFAVFTASGFAQSIFKPVPSNLFSHNLTASNVTQNASTWFWRFSAEVTAEELTWNKTTKQFDSAPLSSVGPAIGYRHFVPLADGTPYNDFGVNLALLLGTDINTIDPATLKVALMVNAFKFVNLGVDTNFKTVGILLGASINF